MTTDSHVAPHACASCGAPIIWALTETNRPIALNWLPRPDGTFILEERGKLANDEDLTLYALDRYRPDRAPRFVAHSASCPHASEWRRKPESIRR